MKRLSVVAVALTLGLASACFGQAQSEGLTRDKSPPPANKLYEDNLRLPDDASKLFLPDDAYLRWPLPPGEEAYAGVDGMAMKKIIPEITAISRKSRDDGNQFWGRIAGTVYDRMIQLHDHGLSRHGQWRWFHKGHLRDHWRGALRRQATLLALFDLTGDCTTPSGTTDQ